MRTATSRQEILEALDQELPDDATLEDAIDFLFYLHLVDEGLADVEAGRLIPHDEVLRQIATWRKEPGRIRR